MEKLISLLLTGAESPPVTSFTPGSIACLELAEDNTWAMHWMIRPELLRES
jgi:hypothetical protein